MREARLKKREVFRDPHAEKSLLAYLDGVAKVMGDRPSLPGFVKARGRLFKPAPLPASIRRKKAKECFANALTLCAALPGLTYVEGYAVSVIPTLHAWCVTADGTVVDPTWDDPERCAYYGIPFDDKFAMHTIVEQGVYGMLGEPATVRKLLDLPPEAYLAEGF